VDPRARYEYVKTTFQKRTARATHAIDRSSFHEQTVVAAQKMAVPATIPPMIHIALIRDVFFDAEGPARLEARLEEAKARGAVIAILPELPLNPWSAATSEPIDDDAEDVGGPRAQVQQRLASTVGIGLVGGAIVRDSAGVRRNTALVFDRRGTLLSTYAKCHIPAEPGFRESDHYAPGESFATPIDGLGVPLGVQICSDANRPQGIQALSALGAELVVVPRATEVATWHRWAPVLRASALTSCCYVASVNRPEPEHGVLLGGPSYAVAPDGEVLVETDDAVAVFGVDRGAMERFRTEYPGYIAVRSDLYEASWRAVQHS
jgi:predicted amidohydrolase